MFFRRVFGSTGKKNIIMNKILSIDPGNTKSAYIVFDLEDNSIVQFDKIPNRTLLGIIPLLKLPLVTEYPFPRGQGVSWQTFDVCEWCGFFHHEAELNNLSFTKMNRTDIKKNLCPGQSKIKDAHVRKALIKRFGGEDSLLSDKCLLCKGKGFVGSRKNKTHCSQCLGTGKVTPGVLYGISADVWQALAVAVTYKDIGPSKSGEELQQARKERKALEKEDGLDMICRLEKALIEASFIVTKTEKQKANKEKKILSIKNRLLKLNEKYSNSK